MPFSYFIHRLIRNIMSLLFLDLLSLGTISTFLNKNDYSILNNNNEKSNNKFIKQENGPVIVAQSATSIPPQFLMLEALWSQLFRDIIQLTHLVHFNTNDERNHIVGQLIRCQDLFRTQWADLAEENQTLKEVKYFCHIIFLLE